MESGECGSESARLYPTYYFRQLCRGGYTGEIDEADAVILAIAVGIDGEERFEEKQDAGKVIQVEPGDVIKDAVRVIDQAENL